MPVSLDTETVLSEWLSDMKSRRVRVWAAQRGDRKHLLDMAEANARERFNSRGRTQKRDTAILDTLKGLLKLPRTPERIACVDISNLQGRHAVGAVVVFEQGHPDKNSYRRFRIRLKDQPDDPAMMSEVITRLFENDAELFSSLDLLLLDGGKGQLNTIVRLLDQIETPEPLPVASIAKEREWDVGEKGKGLYEKIYLPGRKNPLFLHRHPDILHLLQRIRDEAHRFAITHYQNVHRTSLLTSALDAIPGIGPGRRQMLLQRFGDIDAIQEATVFELESAGLPQKVARSVLGVLSEVETRAVLEGQEETSGPPGDLP